MIVHSVLFHVSRFAPVPDAQDTAETGLRSFAGSILTGCVVLTVIAACVSAIMFIAGKLGQSSETKAKSIAWAARIFAGAVILGSLSGAILFGSGLGRLDLLPTAAQPPNVTITKNPAKFTCSNSQNLTRKDSGGSTSDADMSAAMKALISDSDAKRIMDKDTALVDFLLWYPKGPECSETNHAPDPCRKVEVTITHSGDPLKTGDHSFDLDPINKGACVPS